MGGWKRRLMSRVWLSGLKCCGLSVRAARYAIIVVTCAV